MRAGRLREVISFQRRTESLDGYGDDRGTWTDLATVRAQVEPLTGREFFASQQTQSEVSVRVVCRYSPDIAGVTVKDRIKHGDVYYDIRSIINVNSRNTELQFMCTHHSIT